MTGTRDRHQVDLASLRPCAEVATPRLRVLLPAMRLLSLLFVFCMCILPVAATDIIVDWSPDSVLFNKGHLVTKKFAKMRDQVVFDCPEDMPISILMVSRKEAIDCDVSGRFNETLIGLCTPERKRINFVVRDFSLLPNVPIFKEDVEYYFISTSNGTESGMRNTMGGFCRTHDMRLALKVSGRAKSKSDTSRNPDILMLFSVPQVSTQEPPTFEREPTHVPAIPKNSDLEFVLNAKPSTTTAPKIDTTYPAYIVFPDRLSIIVESEKELRTVIDAYMKTHRPPNRNYNIFPIRELKKAGAENWVGEQLPSQNTEYEIKGTPAPLSSEHAPTFQVEPEVNQKRRPNSVRKAFGHSNGNWNSHESILPFDYEIGYEDALSASPSHSAAFVTSTAILIAWLHT